MQTFALEASVSGEECQVRISLLHVPEMSQATTLMACVFHAWGGRRRKMPVILGLHLLYNFVLEERVGGGCLVDEAIEVEYEPGG